MKKVFIFFSIIPALFYPFINVNAQNPEWLNFSNGQVQMALADEANVLWIGTGGDLVRLDKTTGDRIFTNFLLVHKLDFGKALANRNTLVSLF